MASVKDINQKIAEVNQRTAQISKERGTQLQVLSPLDEDAPDSGSSVYDTNNTSGIVSGTEENADFIKTIQDRLLAQSDVVSSFNTQLEDSLKKQTASVTKGLDATKARLESQRQREVGYARDEQAAQVTTAIEGQRGYAVQMPALRRLVETTDKEIKDLDQRYQELILQGEANAADQVRQIQSDILRYRFDAQKEVFNNLLQLGNFKLAVMQEERLSQPETVSLKSSDVQTFVDANGQVTAKNKLTGETLWSAGGIAKGESNISTFTDASGMVTAVNKETGEVLWKARVGRSGSASPNISVKPIEDPVTGNMKYTQIIDEDTGKITYIDNDGNAVDPDQVQLGEGQDDLDIFLNGIFEDLLTE